MLDECMLVDQFLKPFRGSEVILDAVPLASPGRTCGVFLPLVNKPAIMAVYK